MTAEDRVALSRAGDVVTARRGDAVLGFLHLRVVGEALAVEALFVDASARGEGLGRALWRAAEAAAAGAARITVEAEPEAQGFYEAMGCAVIGERAGENGSVRMEKPLGRTLNRR